MLSVFARTSPKTTYLSGGRKSNQKDDVISTAYQDVIFVIFLVRNDSVPVYKCIKYYMPYVQEISFAYPYLDMLSVV